VLDAEPRFVLGQQTLSQQAQLEQEAALRRFLRRGPIDDGGFLPLREAARAMSMSELQVVELVERGALRARVFGSVLEVVPAVVSIASATQRQRPARAA
jgi:hypothetical protein